MTTIGFVFVSNISKKMFSTSSEKKIKCHNLNCTLRSKLPLPHVSSDHSKVYIPISNKYF